MKESGGCWRQFRRCFGASLVVLLSVTTHAGAAADHRGARSITYEDLLGIVDLGVIGAFGLGTIAVSPDSTTVALETRHADWEMNQTRIQWVVIPLSHPESAQNVGDGGEPVPLVYEGTSTGFAPFQIPKWSVSSNAFFYLAHVSGSTQLWRSSRDGTQTKLTALSDDIVAFSIAADGNRIFVRTRAHRDPVAEREAAQGYVFDERFDLLNSRSAIPLGTDSTGEPPKNGSAWVYEINTGSARHATDAEVSEFKETVEEVKAATAGLASSGRELQGRLEDLRIDQARGVKPPLTLVATQGRDRIAICRWARCTGQFRGVWALETNRTLLGLRWAGEHDFGPMELVSWNLVTNSAKVLLRTESLLEGCTLAGMQLICGEETATSPMKLVTVDVRSGVLRTVYDPNHALRNRRFGEVSALSWRDRNGVEGFGHLVKPVGYRAGTRYPLIVVQYRSRGFLRGGVGDEYPIHVLASKGFAVLSFHRPDDWPRWETSASLKEAKAQGWIGFTDRRRVLSVLEAGIDKIIELGIADPNKIGITGLSDGAETLSFALIHSPKRFAAAISSGDPWNPITYYLGGLRSRPLLEGWGFGDPHDSIKLDHWKGVSLGLNAAGIDTPLLLQVSDTELLPNTETFMSFVTKERPIAMHVFRDEYHVKSQPAHRMAIYRRAVQWFQFWLNGYEDPEPVDPLQFTRWRELRSLQQRRLPE